MLKEYFLFVFGRVGGGQAHLQLPFHSLMLSCLCVCVACVRAGVCVCVCVGVRERERAVCARESKCGVFVLVCPLLSKGEGLLGEGCHCQLWLCQWLWASKNLFFEGKQ